MSLAPAMDRPPDTSPRATRFRPRVVVGCPDSRPPAYQAAIGLARSGRLDRFVTSYYHREGSRTLATLRQVAPGLAERLDARGRRRHHPGIPAGRVQACPAVDLALALENRLEPGAVRRAVARARTEYFDRVLARAIAGRRPDVAFLFSDVGSRHALAACRRLGVPVVLSVVHGEVHAERALLDHQRRRDPEGFRLYLGDTRLDEVELAWLHARRLRDAQGATLILVPSEHLAREYRKHGVPADRLRVVPYAADTERFRPIPRERPSDGCTFLFAGGICGRKGIGDLLRAWTEARQPGWRLRLLGAPPRNLAALDPWPEGVEVLGRRPHAEVPAIMGAADVFVFPSLFEGSAVVTYEALACGLPAIVTEAAGSVVRDGLDGLVVPSGDPQALAKALRTLGEAPDLRARMAASARDRARSYDWPRYHQALNEAVEHAARFPTFWFPTT